MDSGLKKYFSYLGKTEIFFYLLIFFLPYIEVPFLKKLFVLKLSNDFAVIAGFLLLRQAFLKKIKLALPFSLSLILIIFIGLASSIRGLRLPLDGNLAGATGRNAPRVFSFVTLFWMIFAVCLFWMTVNIIDKKSALLKALKVYIVSASIVSLYGIWTVIGYKLGIDTGLKFTEQYWLVPRLASTALEPIFFANYLLSVLPLALIMYLTCNDLFNEYIFLVFIFIQLVALFMTFSTTAWAGFFVAMFLIAIILHKHLRVERIIKIAVPALVFACILMFVGAKYYPRLLSLNSNIISKYSNTVKKSTYNAAGEFYRAEFGECEKFSEIQPGAYRALKINVKNTGTKTWASGGNNPVQLTYSWVNPRQYTEKNVLKIRAHLPLDIQPGETAVLNAFVRAPLIPGKYRLKLDMIEEYVDTFQEQGRSQPLSMEVNVSGPVQSYAMAIVKTIPPLPSRLVPGKIYRLKMKIQNTGTIAWETKNTKYPVRFGYRWLNDKGMLLGNFEPRVNLPGGLKPGESAFLTADVMKPVKAEQAGYNTLKFDMVMEGVIWFSEQNTIPPYYIKNTGPVLLKEYRPNVYTVIERWWLWRAAVNMFREHPVLGVGLGNYTFLYNRYKPADAMFKDTMPVVNNQYLEILVETGILGSCAFLLFVYSILRNFKNGFKNIPDVSGRIMFIGLAGCLLALAIQLNFFCGKVLHYLWITLGLAYASMNIYIRGNHDE